MNERTIEEFCRDFIKDRLSGELRRQTFRDVEDMRIEMIECLRCEFDIYFLEVINSLIAEDKIRMLISEDTDFNEGIRCEVGANSISGDLEI